MHSNPVIQALMSRASVRSYKPEAPADEVIATIVRAGQQAPFAMQLCSVILQREGKLPFAAPLQFIICADAHRMQLILERRGWKLSTNDLTLLTRPTWRRTWSSRRRRWGSAVATSARRR
jgi:nitroreductase